jgi:hypothetical protein
VNGTAVTSRAVHGSAALPPVPLHLEIGGIAVRVRSESPGLRLGAPGPAGLFRSAPRPPDLDLFARLDDILLEAPGEPLFRSGSLWQLYRNGGRHHFRFVSGAFGEAPYKTADLDPGFRTGEVRLQRSAFAGRAEVYPLEYPLDELILMHLLAGGLGAEVHGCGLSVGRDGVLFVGQSGAGKTTTARLWEREPDTRVLSDDRIILREQEGELRMYGTPWHGEARLAAAEWAPLRALWFLRHGPENRAAPLTAADAVARLMTCSFFPFYHPDALAFTLEFFDRLTRRVPCRELTFVPDGSAVTFVRERLAD